MANIEVGLLRRLGMVDILPQEQPWSQEIRWESFLVRAALRLGPSGSYLFDPKGQFSAIGEAIPDGNIIAAGVNRRLKAEPSPFANQVLAWRLKTGVDQAPGDDKVLIVAHKNTPKVGEIIERQVGKFASRPASRVGDLANLGVFSSITPYMGAAIIATELEAEGISRNVRIVDYHDLRAPIRSDLVLLTGALSLDVRDLSGYEDKLSEHGATCVIGGLAPTIDTNAVLLLTKRSHVFVGEAEGALAPMTSFLREVRNDGNRYVFHRGGKSGSKPLVVPDQDMANVKHVYLGVPLMVNLADYYSPERERGGQLASRLRHQMSMLPEMTVGNHTWDPPGWLMTQAEFTRGCPKGCSFCSTVNSVGREMRRMPLDSLALLVRAIETKFIVAVDQNFGAISRSEDNADGKKTWTQYTKDFLSLLIANDKRLLGQTDFDFFRRVMEDPDLPVLVKKSVMAVLTGIEDPRGVKGHDLKSHTESYGRDMAIVRSLGVVNVATVIAGLRPDQLVQGGDLSTAEFASWVVKNAPHTMVAFPLMRFPGASGVAPTRADADPNAIYTESFTTPAAYQQSTEITKRYYKLKNVLLRMLKTPELSLKRKTFILALNLAVKAMLLAGSDFRLMARKMR